MRTIATPYLFRVRTGVEAPFLRRRLYASLLAMIETLTKELIAGLKTANVTFVSWLPDTWLGATAIAASKDPDFSVVQVTNEAEGIAACAGAWLGGSRPVLLMENTGLLVAVHNIEYVCAYYGIPVLMIMSYRGALGDGLWWFSGLGERAEPVLKLWQIHYEVITRADRLRTAIPDAVLSMENSKRPAALLIPKSVVS